jgi:branched-chain amino acid transport system permease protein
VVLLAVPLGGLLGALVELVIVRPMAADPPINLLILTIGLWIVFNSATGWIWDPYRMPSLFSTSAVDVLGVQVSPSSLGIVFMAFGAMALLYFFFEHTRFGAAMRAATMNNRAAKLVGVEPSHVTIAAWSIGGALSSLCGVLIAPTIFVDHDMMVSLLLKAFAGSVLGGFNSLPGAVVGSLALGVAESLLGSLVSTKFKDTAAFAVIVLVLMFKPAGLLGHSTRKKM